MGEGPASSVRCQGLPLVKASPRLGVAPGNANLPIGDGDWPATAYWLSSLRRFSVGRSPSSELVSAGAEVLVLLGSWPPDVVEPPLF